LIRLNNGITQYQFGLMEKHLIDDVKGNTMQINNDKMIELSAKTKINSEIAML